MQQIKRSDLVLLYDNFTSSQHINRILPYLINNTNEVIELRDEDIKDIFLSCNNKQAQLLEGFGIKIKKTYTLDDLNSYEDACKILNQGRMVMVSIDQEIKTIVKAANFIDDNEQYWKVDPNNYDQSKYRPYFKTGPSGSGWVFGVVDNGYFGGSLGLGFYFKNITTCKLIAERFIKKYNKWMND